MSHNVLSMMLYTLQVILHDRAMLSYVRGSHHKYVEALQRKRETDKELSIKQAAKKRVAAEIKVLQIKKSKVVEAAENEAKKLEHAITELQKINKL